jgi:hypothetical protein
LSVDGSGVVVPLRSDENISDPDLLFGAQLIARMGTPARSEFQKRRVLARLRATPGARFGGRLRVAHLGFASVFLAAVSSAAVAAYFRSPTQESQPAAVQSAPLPVAAPATESRQVLQPSSPAASAEQPAPAASETSAPVTKPKRMTVATRATPSVTRAQQEADARLLVEAMRLRKNGDSERVSKLVEEYRRKQPGGALQEEALTLAIESALARRDPNAAQLGREYLSRFPNGRFKAQAKRALASDSR